MGGCFRCFKNYCHYSASIQNNMQLDQLERDVGAKPLRDLKIKNQYPKMYR